MWQLLKLLIEHEQPVPMQNYKTKLHGFSQQDKYTDRATAACRRS
jgi:hypothetical protein